MKLKVNIYLRNTLGINQPRFLLCAAAGFRRHGIVPRMLSVFEPQICDLAVCWGVKKSASMDSGRRCLVFERGYVGDRFSWTSAGYDGLNGYADFCVSRMPGDRWEKNFAGVMKPWRGHDGFYVLLMGQVTGDASVRHVDIGKWYRDTATELLAKGHKVAFRPHPKAKHLHALPPGVRITTGTIEEDFKNAQWAVSFNSNSSLDAVLAGVPAVTCDPGAMAWRVTGHEAAVPPPMPDRTQWAHDIAYSQWNEDEISSGLTWDHLKSGMLEQAA